MTVRFVQEKCNSLSNASKKSSLVSMRLTDGQKLHDWRRKLSLRELAIAAALGCMISNGDDA